MAEYCRNCSKRILGFTEKELKHAVFSAEDDLELCEGCGEYKQVLIKIEDRKFSRIPFLRRFFR